MMAYIKEPLLIDTYLAGADLSAAQFRFVEFTSGNVTRCNAAGERALGVLQNNPKSGAAADVVLTGITKVVASAAIAQGALITTTNDGKAVTAASGNTVNGRALEAATADGQLITAQIFTGPVLA